MTRTTAGASFALPRFACEADGTRSWADRPGRRYDAETMAGLGQSDPRPMDIFAAGASHEKGATALADGAPNFHLTSLGGRQRLFYLGCDFSAPRERASIVTMPLEGAVPLDCWFCQAPQSVIERCAAGR